MRISPIRTIWLTTFSIFVMLMSNLAFSTPLMTFKMLDQSHSMSTNFCASPTDTNNLTHSNQGSMSDCGMDSDSMANCSTASCTVATAIIWGSPLHITPTIQRSEISYDSVYDIRYQARSLYRPPIA